MVDKKFGKSENNQQIVHDADFPQKYCIYILRKFDFENFYNTKFIDNQITRRTAFAIRAFNTEISQIRDVTTQDQIARMRFQFWYDGIENAMNAEQSINHPSPKQQPLLYEISECNRLCDGRLSKRWFKRLIDTRDSPEGLSNFPFTTIQELESYSENSVSPVFYLISEAILSQITSSKSTPGIQLKLDHIGSHIGKAQGLANVVRGIIHNAKYNRCYIPSELLVKHNVTHQDLIKINDKPAIKVIDVCYDIASLSHQHIIKAKKLTQDSSLGQFSSIFLPIITLERFLDKLRRNNFDVTKTTWGRKDLFFPLVLFGRSRLWKLGRII
ncbi:NADH dehydrogenase (ubiquinone) complex I, assembly factor 6-like [Panonychus citri]|uniref:NADH dehydrogenase (ubiquinone) complex I, assembly factor 6-like n=1 Tax=Panonychus citri TaxID=50023 RepID=UPI00230719BC|nr:NADH dehydrogenase (ubiquinone) complex I, assembly factor 6-like [Panonychus citri]